MSNPTTIGPDSESAQAVHPPRSEGHDLLDRLRRDSESRKVLRMFARATGLSVHLEAAHHPHHHDDTGHSCSLMQGGSAEARRACASRRQALTKPLEVTAGSRLIPCPVGSFCLGAAIFLGGNHLATVRAGGFAVQPPVDRERADAVREMLALVAGRLEQRAQALLSHPEGRSPAVQHALQYLREHDDRHITVAALAAAVGVSRQHLTRLWRTHLGVPLHAFLSARRIDRACQMLLTSDRKIIDVALACGFGSVSQFNRVFHKVRGMSPHEFVQGRGKA